MVLYFIRSEIHFMMFIGMLMVGALFIMPFFTFLGIFYKEQLDENKTEKFKLSEKVTTWNKTLCHVPDRENNKMISCKSGCCNYILPDHGISYERKQK